MGGKLLKMLAPWGEGHPQVGPHVRVFGGIDPYNIWIDRNSDDNVIAAATS
ncbi:MAG TPA: hypothetical protein VKR31_09970 [Rhizomicrobium sp.]|nr:hypothetical protein [Rhizomicrobium sp.]